MSNNCHQKTEKSGADSPRPIDMAIHQSFINIKRNLVIASQRKVATWQGLLIIVFLSGFVSALFWAGYKDLYTDIFADSDQITNTASVTYEDSTGADYGPVTDTFNITKTEIPDTVPPAKITDLIASNITSTSVGLTWTAPGDDGNVGTATSYDIRYSTKKIDDKDDTDWDSAMSALGEPAPQTAGATETFTVDQLTPGADYWFVMKTSDGVNESPLSYVLSVKTILGGPTETVKKIKISLPKDYDENVKVVVIDHTTGNTIEEVKVKIVNQKIDIIFKQELNMGLYYIMIIAPDSLSKKKEVDLDVDDKDIVVSDDELPAGNLSDEDDIINAADWEIMRGQWGNNLNPKEDLNQDGLVNTLDWSIMKKYWGADGDCPKESSEEITACRNRSD